MIEITSVHSQNIAAGNLSLWEATLIATNTYAKTAKWMEQIEPLFVEATHIYGKIGRALSAHLFEVAHPDALGKMSYPVTNGKKQSAIRSNSS